MNTIHARNVNHAVSQALPLLLETGIREESRNGRVLVMPDPVTTVYHSPKEHVLFGPTRDANPFFHLMEALWMLAGRNDLSFPLQFNKRFASYSDDGKTVWGAYGWRWRQFFGYDQLAMIIDELKKNPNSRRCVLSMWNGWDGSFDGACSTCDLMIGFEGGKDVPCNTQAYFDLRGGVLNMTVCNRSNDVIWGAYGANAVHFSLMLEYMAEQIGVPVGVYRQMSNNFHAYLDIYNEEALERITHESKELNFYITFPDLPKIPLGSTDENWVMDLALFMGTGTVDISRPTFFSQVAGPMLGAWNARRAGDHKACEKILKHMAYCDWQVACLDWVIRRSEVKDAA